MLKEYAISIICVSILSVMLEIILPPKNYRKYISVIIGLVIMMVIISPLKNLFQNLGNTFFEIPETNYEITPFNSNSLVADEFCRRLEEKITQEVLKNLNTELECRVYLSLSEKFEIEAIKALKINPLTEETANFISKNFDIEREKIGGFNDEY